MWVEVYGDYFNVEAVQDAINLAYTNSDIQPHNDLPYYKSPPDIQWFHCITQGEKGGENFFVDGINCAETLRRTNPLAFHTLANSDVLFFDIGDNWHLKGT